MRVARIWRCSKWLCEKNQITPTLQSVPNVSIISRKKTGIWGPPTYGNGKVREICRTFLCEEKKKFSPDETATTSHLRIVSLSMILHTLQGSSEANTLLYSGMPCHRPTTVRTMTKLLLNQMGQAQDRTGESSPRQRSDSGPLCSPLKPSLSAPLLLSSHA